ncbi:BTAD domain-containing putative transcriptional regulator [Jiangella asiatica]|uniref:Helix-turn-helix domain-containing protein n=1 Tax=Jiangella asiatica TaxID=2530372 RepID=A0A4R5DAH3_9ACTN|nr:BTAD domain-containing putative transcriptional regulator [Jiangella asiatica]TDE10626.1 helix-turn-helix domain-containing protein [Jiangella asiatica]
MRIGILGPLEVRDDDAPVYVAGARLRTLLIILALEPGRLVPVAQLVDGIWGDDPPAGATNALQALVSRLRRALPGLAIESHPAGYRLALEPDAVDAARFERQVATARSASDDATVEDGLRAALALWRGPALLDVAETEFFEAPRARLEELRLTATEDRVDAALRLGRGAGLTTELTTLVAEYPVRERLVEQLMRALVAAGRPAAALAAYERTRGALADELGTDPSAELSALHTAILRADLTSAAPAPPARVADPAPQPAAPRTNLRAGLSSFIGRDADVARVRDLVGEYRLTTLTGPGGSGKTRLASEASRTLTDQLSAGVWLVELALVAADADVPSAVLGALDLRDQAFGATTEDATGRLVAALRTRTALLVLDNCEHVIGAAATLADRLLGECPDLRILATSREPLGITGEAVWPVEPLRLPPEHVDGADLLRFDAIRLLVDRARAVRPGFTVTDADAPAVARICRALDGMPLAIELAAARLRTMTVEQLAARLDDRFRLLTGGSRTALPRHQTLRAVVDWSWGLLPEPERVVLRRLAVFAGGATAEAAAQVCGDGADVLDALISLSDKSLLVVEDDGEAPRYRLLETIKAYGLERLDEVGELDTVRRAHIGWLIELAETAEPHLHRAEQLVWLRRLRAVHDDITVALRGASAAGDAENAVRLVVACGWYWWLSGHKNDGIELAIQALAVPGPTDPEARATACAVVTFLITSGVGDLREAADWVRQARELSAGIADPGPFLRFMAPLSVILGAEDEPLTTLADALAPLLEDPDPWFRAQARLTRAQMLPTREREADLTQALTEFRMVGERWGISYALTTLADLHARRGELERAIEQYEQAIVAISEIGTVDDIVMMRSRLAQLRWLTGDRAGSAAEVVRAERDAEQVAWPDGLAIMALHRAGLAGWAGDTVTARQQLVRAQALLRDIPIHPVFQAIMLEIKASLDVEEGRWDAAAAARTQALTAVLSSEDSGEETVGAVLAGIADHALRQGRPADAVRLLAAVEVLAGGLDRSAPGGVNTDEAARAALGARSASKLLAETERELAGLDGDAANSWLRELAASVLGHPVSEPGAGGTA